MSGLTAQIADFIVTTPTSALSPQVRNLIQRAAIDTTAVMLAGGSEEATQLIRAQVASMAAAGQATVVGTAQRTHPAQAALANGISAHAHDFDDTQVSPSPEHVYGLMTHPSASAWAATLAMAEAQQASGAETLTAYLIGLEVACRLCEAIDPYHYIRGFHTTATLGIFGATAAACRLAALTTEQTRHALGLAASMASGIRSNFGSMAKPLHAGRAAESGVLAAQLAARGFTAKPDALEHPGGFFKTFASPMAADDPALLSNPLWGYSEVAASGYRTGVIPDKLGRPWAIERPGISIKPYPSVVLSHPSMTTLLDLLEQHQVAPERIRTIRVHAGPTVRHIMYRIPETGTQGKFSLIYCLALIACRRRAALADYLDHNLEDPALQAMMTRIELCADNEFDQAGYESINSRIEVVLDDGTQYLQVSGAYKGGPDAPLSDAELEAKFHDCAQVGAPHTQAEAALQTLKRLWQLPNIQELTQHLRSVGPTP